MNTVYLSDHAVRREQTSWPAHGEIWAVYKDGIFVQSLIESENQDASRAMSGIIVSS